MILLELAADALGDEAAFVFFLLLLDLFLGVATLVDVVRLVDGKEEEDDGEKPLEQLPVFLVKVEHGGSRWKLVLSVSQRIIPFRCELFIETPHLQECFHPRVDVAKMAVPEESQ